MKYQSLILSTLLLFTDLASSQQPKRWREEAVRLEINSLLQNLRGSRYVANDVVDMDSLIGDMRYYVEPLENPYGTLSNAFVFTTGISPSAPSRHLATYSGDSNAVGVFRNGSILWMSEPEIGWADGFVFATHDINNDGTVELLSIWDDGTKQGQLWIHSWNGTTGQRINDILDGQPYSAIEADKTGFVLFDANGDGVLEIKNLDVTDGSLTWSWNGQEYGMWPSTPHLSEATWLPRNNFSIAVRCDVQKPSGFFEFSYHITLYKRSKSRDRDLPRR